MDPFTAFSLVCGIIELVNFSSEVVKKCRELYRDGASSENNEVEEMAEYLTDLRTNLDLQDRDGPDELLDLGSKCSQTAHELIAALQKLKVSGPQRKRQVAGKAFKAIRTRRALDEIQKRLDNYRKLLDGRILVDLRSVLCHRLSSIVTRASLLYFTY